MKDKPTIPVPTVEEIDDQYLSYQKDLAIRDLHLKLLVRFTAEDIDDIIDLLKDSYVVAPSKGQ